MANHVETFHSQRPSHIAVPALSVHKIGEDWAHTNKKKGDMKIHPSQINAVVCPETGKPQDYRYLIKGPDKPK